jgi:hypothetical protein
MEFLLFEHSQSTPPEYDNKKASEQEKRNLSEMTLVYPVALSESSGTNRALVLASGSSKRSVEAADIGEKSFRFGPFKISNKRPNFRGPKKK